MNSHRWPSTLTWDEVDPRRHPSDSASAFAVVSRLEPAGDRPTRPAGATVAAADLPWQVLTWFLTRWDVPPERAETLVEEAIGSGIRAYCHKFALKTMSRKTYRTQFATRSGLTTTPLGASVGPNRLCTRTANHP